MELTEEQKEELKLLAEWKRVFNMPNHFDPETKSNAQIGALYKPDDFRSTYMSAETTKNLPDLRQFPLTLSKRDDNGEVHTKIVNPRFKERSLFQEFLLVKRGNLPEEYYEAYL